MPTPEHTDKAEPIQLLHMSKSVIADRCERQVQNLQVFQLPQSVKPPAIHACVCKIEPLQSRHPAHIG